MTEKMLDLDQVWQRQAAATVEKVDDERGLIDVKIVPYEFEGQLDEGFSEIFSRGAFAAALGNPTRIKVSDQQHNRAVIVGNAVELREQDDGLHGTLRIAQTAAGKDLLTLLTPDSSGNAVLDQLSVEFRPNKRHVRFIKRAGDVLIRHDKATLLGVSPVGAGVYGDHARVLAVRAVEADHAREKELAYLATLTAGA